MKRSLTASAILLLLLSFSAASCTTFPTAQRVKIKTSNRHACDYCHANEDPKADPALLVPAEETGTVCVHCHEFGNRHYPLHHPFGFVPQRTDFVNPDKTFPLYDNRLECMTCHTPHAGTNYTETPNLLRGGPYADRRQICFRCHSQEVYAKIDPHRMKDESGKVRVINDRPACLYCHAAMPDPQTQKTVDVRFRADIGFLCWRCHPPMPGEFFHGHFLKKPVKKTMKTMRDSEKKADVIMPIIPRNRVTCSTCHNPHQEGVIVAPAAAKGADSKGKLRLPKDQLCAACHEQQ